MSSTRVSLFHLNNKVEKNYNNYNNYKNYKRAGQTREACPDERIELILIPGESGRRTQKLVILAIPAPVPFRGAP